MNHEHPEVTGVFWRFIRDTQTQLHNYFCIICYPNMVYKFEEWQPDEQS